MSVSSSTSTPGARSADTGTETAVLIDSSRAPRTDNEPRGVSRHGSRDKARACSPGVNGGTAGSGITHKTQIQVTRRSGTARGSWKLKYQDFLPARNPEYVGDPESEFRKLVARANDWLARNTEITVKTCETVTWINDDVRRLGDGDQMLLCKRAAPGANNYHIRGLRLWIVPVARKKAQCLTHTDVCPADTDTLQTLINKVNTRIQQNTLDGKIISFETLSVPVINGNIDSDISRWAENASDDSPYAFCIRVFSNKNLPGNGATVGVQDFIPVLTDEGYEGFDDLSDRANAWLVDKSDVIVTNMQSVLVQKDEGPHSETGRACRYIMPGIDNEDDTEFFRILRVAYICPGDDTVAEVPVIYPFTYEIFSPELIPARDSKGQERVERLKETFVRVNAFLKASGADVISVETVMNPMQILPESLAQDPDVMQFFLTVRVFVTDQIKDPIDGALEAGDRVLSLSKMGNQNSHPGPIFLKSVVNRQYKYRWVVVAVAVFTSMTIIVVISVVYSNT